MAARKNIHRRRPGTPQFDRKLAQLCRQVERRLAFVFAEFEDEALASLSLVGVHSTPDGSRLTLDLLRSPLGTALGEKELLARLDLVRAQIRGEVAEAIHRRRTPAIDFRLLDGLPELE